VDVVIIGRCGSRGLAHTAKCCPLNLAPRSGRQDTVRSSRDANRTSPHRRVSTRRVWTTVVARVTPWSVPAGRAATTEHSANPNVAGKVSCSSSSPESSVLVNRTGQRAGIPWNSMGQSRSSVYRNKSCRRRLQWDGPTAPRRGKATYCEDVPPLRQPRSLRSRSLCPPATESCSSHSRAHHRGCHLLTRFPPRLTALARVQHADTFVHRR
jgi:hypothetical protein